MNNAKDMDHEAERAMLIAVPSATAEHFEALRDEVGFRNLTGKTSDDERVIEAFTLVIYKVTSAKGVARLELGLGRKHKKQGQGPGWHPWSSNPLPQSDYDNILRAVKTDGLHPITLRTLRKGKRTK